jgi:hypothetical protein
MLTDHGLQRLPARPPIGKIVHVIRVGANARLTMACCSPAPIWFLGHWDGRHTVRCTMLKKGTCEGHAKQWPERAKGYLTVCNLRDRKPQLLELTPGAGEILEHLFPHSESMRGHMLYVSREHETLKSRVLITRLERCPEGIMLPQEEDPEPTVNRLWPDRP